jgi:hypothetical protein
MPSAPRLSPLNLTSLRQNTHWRELFSALQIQKDPKKSKDSDWWAKSPFRPQENTASFHMNARGWYCHATGQGGGPIELLQRLYPGMSCYDAGRWLLAHGVSRIVEGVREEVATAESEPEEAIRENPPIRQDLRSQLVPEHPDFGDRGIPAQTLEILGAGYLERPPRKNGKPDLMNQRLVFQIRSLRSNDAGELVPVIVGHMGRATSVEQAEQDGKWWTYAGFRKSLELYNVDLAVLNPEARAQAAETGHVLVVEGCFDVAKLYAAGIKNVVALFGSRLSERQAELLVTLAEEVGVQRLRFFLDRDAAGQQGTASAQELLLRAPEDNPGLVVDSFDWEQSWQSPVRGAVQIPASITDPCDFSLGQLQWLRTEGLL